MERVNWYQWKQAMEGLARGDVGPFEQYNDCINGISYIEYYDGRNLVMRLICMDQGLSIPNYEAKKYFDVDAKILQKTSYIYVPTDEEYEEWNDIESFENDDHVAAKEIAKKEGRVYINPRKVIR